MINSLIFVCFIACAISIHIVKQESELDPAVMVIVHKPSSEVFFSSFHPHGALFEKPTSRSLAQKAHENFIAALDKFGVPHTMVTDGLSKFDKERLIHELVYGHYIQYSFQGNVSTLSVDDLSKLGTSYLLKALENDSVPELLDLFLLRPTIHLEKSEFNNPLKTVGVELNPMGNMVFTRDQQIITAKGLVIGKMNSDQRRHETTVMKLFFEANETQPICEVEGSGRLEGGDFMPVSRNLAMVGIGLRSNWEAVHQLLEKDCFGTQNVAVVEDINDKSQDRMHLDTFFNIADDKRVVILEDILKDEKKQRLVTVYTKKNGKYEISTQKEEFGKFLERNGFTLLHVTNQQQLSYIINFLNLGPTPLGNPTIISVNEELEGVLRNGGFEGRVEYVDYHGITRMYGAVHCTSQVIRNPRSESSTLQKEL